MGAGLYVPPDVAWLTAFETSGPMMAKIAMEIARLARYPAHSSIFPVCFWRAYVNRTDAMPLIAAAMIAPTRRVLNALANTAPRAAGVWALAEITAAAKSTAAMTMIMIPTKNSTIAMTTFRAWVEPNALRPRMTRIAPMSESKPPKIPTIGIHEMSPPMRSRRSPVFVRSICLRRSASHADGRPGIAPPYAPGAGYIGGTPDDGGAPADRGLPQFVQNIVPSLFVVPQRGQVRLVANLPLRHPEQNRG